MQDCQRATDGPVGGNYHNAVVARAMFTIWPPFRHERPASSLARDLRPPGSGCQQFLARQRAAWRTTIVFGLKRQSYSPFVQRKISLRPRPTDALRRVFKAITDPLLSCSTIPHYQHDGLLIQCALRMAKKVRKHRERAYFLHAPPMDVDSVI